MPTQHMSSLWKCSNLGKYDVFSSQFPGTYYNTVQIYLTTKSGRINPPFNHFMLRAKLKVQQDLKTVEVPYQGQLCQYAPPLPIITHFVIIP